MSHIHEAIGQWHDDSTNKQELHEYLGMTWTEYARWAEKGELPEGSPFAGVRPRILAPEPVSNTAPSGSLPIDGTEEQKP